MAKERKIVEVKANCYIRYDFESYETGETFKIRKSDLKPLSEKGYISQLDNEDLDSDNEEAKDSGEVE